MCVCVWEGIGQGRRVRVERKATENYVGNREQK